MSISLLGLPLCSLLIAFVEFASPEQSSAWADWWSYDGISGPEYWGLLNSDWRLCNSGRYQSPINIDPHNLVFDPLLTQIFIDNKEVWVSIVNTGHDVTFMLEKGEPITMLGGPFAYTYRIYQIKIHFGSNYAKGSEHSIAEKHFPVEFQFLGYNENLYVNASVAASAPHGLAGLAVFAQIDNSSSPELQNVFDQIQLIPYKGNSTKASIDLPALLPKTPFFMTYDGSLTFPPCHEVVTWVIMNRPISITESQILQQLYQVDEKSPPVPMENNFRRIVGLMNRTVRTNIKSAGKEDKHPEPLNSCEEGELYLRALENKTIEKIRV